MGFQTIYSEADGIQRSVRYRSLRYANLPSDCFRAACRRALCRHDQALQKPQAQIQAATEVRGIASCFLREDLEPRSYRCAHRNCNGNRVLFQQSHRQKWRNLYFRSCSVVVQHDYAHAFRANRMSGL